MKQNKRIQLELGKIQYAMKTTTPPSHVIQMIIIIFNCFIKTNNSQSIEV